jgi:hypothetical protein
VSENRVLGGGGWAQENAENSIMRSFMACPKQYYRSMEDETVRNVTISKKINAYRILVRKPGEATWNIHTWLEDNTKISVTESTTGGVAT